jgi:hypothetical protein
LICGLTQIQFHSATVSGMTRIPKEYATWRLTNYTQAQQREERRYCRKKNSSLTIKSIEEIERMTALTLISDKNTSIGEFENN